MQQIPGGAAVKQLTMPSLVRHLSFSFTKIVVVGGGVVTTGTVVVFVVSAAVAFSARVVVVVVLNVESPLLEDVDAGAGAVTEVVSAVVEP